MPEYLAPGVYIEEVGLGPRSIQGVSTSTTGFVGATRFGPTSGRPALLTRFLDFQRIYGGLDRLDHGDGALRHNDLAQSVRGFFENGGQRCYVARAFEHTAARSDDVGPDGAHQDHGRLVVNQGSPDIEVVLRARWPGAPQGVNCLRSFDGRGHRVWGARTMSSDPTLRYVNVRRHVTFIERSIDLGTQWAVFEPNGPALWAPVRTSIENFLLGELKHGGLAGSTADEAFFVRCDRTTMTQNDLDNGRLVCEIGIAPVRPAEFIVIRVQQRTLEST